MPLNVNSTERRLTFVPCYLPSLALALSRLAIMVAGMANFRQRFPGDTAARMPE